MRAELRTIAGVTVHEHGDRQCGIVTFSIADTESFFVKDKLAEKNINVSVGQAKSTPLFMNRYGLVSVVKASIHYYNTEEEIGIFCTVLASIAHYVIKIIIVTIVSNKHLLLIM